VKGGSKREGYFMDNSIMRRSWDWQTELFSVSYFIQSIYEKKEKPMMIVTCTHRREIQNGHHHEHFWNLQVL
jgi:hypothetical protein